jgi:hypothetical protein
MPSKRRAVEAVEEHTEDTSSPFLHRLRNMWEFANLCQWIYLFGKAAKIDESIDVEVSQHDKTIQ